jgi:monovalent cation:H+ antiporter, CPA1 family
MSEPVTLFDAAAILVALAAALGYVNYRVFKMPSSVGLTVMGAIASLGVIAVDRLVPGSSLSAHALAFLASLDFHAALMNGMLSFLLFAGALHVNWSEMRRGRWPILVLSTVGVLLSTALVGGGFWLLTRAMGLEIPILWCLVFGALISPTDPVAVMGVLKRAAVPPTLQATVAGESLFNDGVGVVVFAILLATATGTEPFSLAHAAGAFARETGGGILLGLVAGWVACRALRSIDDYVLEVLISLAVVMGGYSLARSLHISGPVAMAVAGLVIGNKGIAHAMSDETQDYLLKFWELIDEVLNAVLFLLIGLEAIAIAPNMHLVLLGLASIPLVIAVRAISVGGPLVLLRPLIRFGPLAFPTLVWGGLRGGISVALALALPENPVSAAILAATYVVVLFAVIVQGSSLAWLVDRITLRHAQRPEANA